MGHKAPGIKSTIFTAADVPLLAALAALEKIANDGYNAETCAEIARDALAACERRPVNTAADLLAALVAAYNARDAAEVWGLLAKEAKG